MDPVLERDTILSSLRDAASPLEGRVKSVLIPPQGLSLGYALRGARDRDGVAAVNVGTRNGGPVVCGTPAFGTDDPVVPVILTLMKFDPAIRSAAILRYSERALIVLEEDLFLDCAVADTASQRPGISTMDWGIASCCREGIPALIWKKSGQPDESRLILTGEGPAGVCSNIIICSNRL